MAEKISQHYHCQMCGKAIPLGETLCSDECKQKYKYLVKRRKLMLYFWIAILVALAAYLLVASSG